MKFSIVTATFNRRTVLGRSIDSSLSFIKAVGGGEVVVVDDGSSDGTDAFLQSRYADQIASGAVKVIRRARNGGSNIARDDGVNGASGDWIVLMDSDDEFLPAAADVIPDFARAHAAAPILFFRCIDQDGKFVGPEESAGLLDLKRLLNSGTPGECLTLIARSAAKTHPFGKEFNSYEFFAMLRMVRDFGPAALSDKVVRRYHTETDNRVSHRLPNMRRAQAHFRARIMALRDFGNLMTPRTRIATVLRILTYGVIALVTLPFLSPSAHR